MRDATGQLRIYDGAAISPSGILIGLEVKSARPPAVGSPASVRRALNSQSHKGCADVRLLAKMQDYSFDGIVDKATMSDQKNEIESAIKTALAENSMK